MNRTERVITAIVLAVNLSVGLVLVVRADYSALVDGAATAIDTSAALSPSPPAP